MKKIIIIFLLSLQMFAFTSCVGNKKEIQKIYLVVAMGIDLTPDKKYEVTLQVLNPSASSTQESSNSTSQSNEILIYSGIGDTFYDAVFETSKVMGKMQHFGHLKYIVLSKRVAEYSDKTFKDNIFRLEDIRLNTPLLVTKGNASEIVSARTKEGIIPTYVVDNLLERQSIIGYRPYTYLLDFVNQVNSETPYPVTGVIELVKGEDKLGSETFKLSGSAVFKKDKLIGFLNDKETRGLNFIKGRVDRGNITAYSSNLGKISLEISNSSSKIKPVLKNDSINIQIKIKTLSVLRAAPSLPDPVKDPKIMDELNDAQNKAIKDEINLALNAAQHNLKADIFGFGEKIHKSSPEKWNSIKENWDSLFENVDINISVESKIRTTGSIFKSME
ncbi:spore germination protein KC [Clostridium sp. USBA 49]|uniref:Ger(x)C family spore germination protein n=1 Tax=Clostridium sp. USBA 49 TaxID=1881060 RepID=UPI00099B10E5|nr:Ger(x)C family spore germination protein [Clostridium sp. USBA 49]SKA91201.1 spore germination protein KC [Clostridium sp. USBA 49]